MKTLYLAKEPGKGVRDDLSRISGEVVVVDCLNAYGDYYTKKGYNSITKTHFFSLDMQFSQVVGNPPYLKNIHLEFLKKSLEIADRVSLIHPAGWTYRATKSDEVEIRELLKGRLKKLTFFNGNNKFQGAHFGQPLVITEAVESHTGPIELFYENTGNTYFIDDIDDLPTGFWEPSDQHLSLVESYKKISNGESLSNMLNNYQDNNNLVTPRVVGHTDRKTNLSDLLNNYENENNLSTPRVVGNKSNTGDSFVKDDYYTFFYRNTNFDKLDRSKKAFTTQTVEERDNLKSYLKTKVARFGLSIHKVSQDLHIKRYMSLVPLVPLDRSWTDELAYQYFNFTDEQIEYIDSFIPDYY